MPAQPSNTPVTADRTFLVGLIITAAVIREGVKRIAKSSLATAPKRPTLMGAMIMCALAKDAIVRIGTVGNTDDRSV
jgi:hypothetical protein